MDIEGTTSFTPSVYGSAPTTTYLKKSGDFPLNVKSLPKTGAFTKRFKAVIVHVTLTE